METNNIKFDLTELQKTEINYIIKHKLHKELYKKSKTSIFSHQVKLSGESKILFYKLKSYEWIIDEFNTDESIF